MKKIKFERYKLPKLPQEEFHQKDISALIKWMVFVVKSLPTRKMPGHDDFISKFLQTFKEAKMLILYNLFQKIGEEENFPTPCESVIYQS